jgi:NADPH-dependent 2,4-dienoyl-CoA reductase/sulfur reductase-like enzyme
MTTRERFVIVGAGLAGAKAAETLRAEGFGGDVVLIGDETEAPYERPGLSKGYLRGETSRTTLRVHDAAFYEDHDIELRAGVAVTALDLDAAQIELEDGGTLRNDRLLLATGAAPRRLDLPGSALPGVHHLRDLPELLAA